MTIRTAAADLYRALVSEHGHDETHPGVWPACLPVHIAMNRYRDALAASTPTSPVYGPVIPYTGRDAPFVGEHSGCTYDAPHRHDRP